MAHSSVSTNKNKTSVLECQGDYQAAGCPLLVLSDTLGLDFKPVLGEVNTSYLCHRLTLFRWLFYSPLCADRGDNIRLGYTEEWSKAWPGD
ncbi:hypothetical protein ES703_44663 [subsurface metagenome]